MAKQRPEENPPERRVLPMDLHVGDRLTDETAEWEISASPYVTNAGKTAYVRVRRVDPTETAVTSLGLTAVLSVTDSSVVFRPKQPPALWGGV